MWLLPTGQKEKKLAARKRGRRAACLAAAKKALTDIAKFDRAKLGAQKRNTTAVIESSLNDDVNAEPFEDFRFVFNQFHGLHVSLVNFLSQTHPIRNRRDMRAGKCKRRITPRW